MTSALQPRGAMGRVRLAALAATLAAGGCATLPATGARATGEPLTTITRSEAFAYVAQDKVGEIRFTDAAGRPAGSAAVYDSHVVHGAVVHWRPAQGGKIIDDEDFFRIAGDVEAARAIQEYRTNGLWLNRTGLALLAVGAGGLAAVRLDSDNRFARALDGASALSIILGGLWAYAGYYRMNPEHHLFDLGRASTAASDYNQAREAGRR